jgi:hypothetical protein
MRRVCLGCLLLAVLAAAACREPGLEPVRSGFLVREPQLDFGRVLEGDTARGALTLVATGRGSVRVSASTSGRFSLPASQVEIAGAGTSALEVLFLAGTGRAEGTLTLVAGEQSMEVPLLGTGVRPLPCRPSSPCRQSRYDLASDSCVESPLPEGAECIPASRCLERGRCVSGTCEGLPRSCDDANPCTVDSCSPEVGCLTSPVACPRPANPCRAGVCDRERGCTEVDVPDSTVCGAVDCVTARLCSRGSCQPFPTPEGFLCAPATPCQDEGRCTRGRCVRPPPEELTPTLSLPLGGTPSAEPQGPVLLSHAGALFTSLCGGDAGCRLASYTESGLLRFESLYPDGGPRTLLALSDAGVLLSEPGALEAWAPSRNRGLLWRVPLASLADAGPLSSSTGTGRVALSPEGEVLTLLSWSPLDGGLPSMDGGTPLPPPAVLAQLSPDGGVRRSGPVEGLGEPARIALSADGGLYLLGAGGPLVRAEAEDGGTGWRTSALREQVADAGPSLAVAGDWLLAGARAFVPRESHDGGTVAVDWEAGGRQLRPLEEPVLLADDTGYAFARACLREGGAPCSPEEETLLLRALQARGGSVLWEVSVLEDGGPGTLHEAALVTGGAVTTLTSLQVDGGVQPHLQLFAFGQRLAACPLPVSSQVAGATWAGRLAWVVLEREGQWWLEAFDLGPLVTLEQRGWPQRHGGAGTRRERP